MNQENKAARRPHDSFFRWLFADIEHLRHLLELSAKVNLDVNKFLSLVNLDTLVRIPDSYSTVGDSGEADMAFRVSVASGAPVLVGILLEHKSGRDPNIFEQAAKYVQSVMRVQDRNRIYKGIPTMAIIFYNGKANWNPLKELDQGYPDYFHGSALPFRCAFVNMADIPDSDCLACEDAATGMGIVAMKYAFDKDNLMRVLPQFLPLLHKMHHGESSCLLQKINIYLAEYLGKDIIKELDMAFVSVGQKYGFESAADYYRKQIAEEHQKTVAAEEKVDKAKAEKLSTARKMVADKKISIEDAKAYFGYTEEQLLMK